MEHSLCADDARTTVGSRQTRLALHRERGWQPSNIGTISEVNCRTKGAGRKCDSQQPADGIHLSLRYGRIPGGRESRKRIARLLQVRFSPLATGEPQILSKTLPFTQNENIRGSCSTKSYAYQVGASRRNCLQNLISVPAELPRRLPPLQMRWKAHSGKQESMMKFCARLPTRCRLQFYSTLSPTRL